ncbi:class I SAM-dependent methyltransferase [Microbacterium dauci]|uniref:Class I SAM-dependent methyltransferase n=1 Tax=Microbacterium dauci TaxID=3048008 RepID=A0ABT6ZD53_9MICO|nr:class I SAM-dependent methyltransferase [Microbacterium sp. LX3-4]MDJ1114079.1 class I SAM-dependent methyltransferase [Microbacterium sp. LX3-4]
MPDLPAIDSALVAALRTDLAAADFTADAVRVAWGPVADAATGRGLLGPALRALEGRTDPLAVLARSLYLGGAASVADMDAALPTTGARGLAALGLVRIDGDEVTPTVLLRPQDMTDADGDTQWWVASDLDEAALGGALPTGHVLGVGGASLTLAGLQLTTPARRVLDLGTGCGIQALRARRAAPQVIATDVSARALWFTELNVALNDLGGVETRLGSLFEPVAGEQFDRVVSNPPFVITPRVAGVPEYEYRDAGFAGDDLVSAFVRGVGDVLIPGGTAQLLGNWEYRGGGDGLDRVRGWVAASAVPLDAWIVEREQLDPLAYAELWVRDGGTVPGSPEYARLIEAWLADFAARGVTAIGFGYLLLRRTPIGMPPLARYERIGQPVAGALGPHLGEALGAWDRLGLLDDEALAASTVIVAGDVTEARHHRPGDEDPTVIELRQGGGFARVLDVDPALAALVGASDGDLPVGVLIDAIADLLDADAAALRADLLPRVRELVFTGFLRLA